MTEIKRFPPPKKTIVGRASIGYLNCKILLLNNSCAILNARSSEAFSTHRSADSVSLPAPDSPKIARAPIVRTAPYDENSASVLYQ